MATKEKDLTKETKELKEKKPRTPRKKKVADNTEGKEKPAKTVKTVKTTSKRAPRKKKVEEVPAQEAVVMPELEQQTQEVTAVTETPKAEPVKKELPVIDTPKEEQAAESYAEKAEAPAEKAEEEVPAATVQDKPAEVKEEKKAEKAKEEKPEPKQESKKPEQKPIPPCPTLLIRNIIDLVNAPKQQLLLNDQQILQLSLTEAEKRFRWIEGTLALTLNYDIVLSDTNIWIELLTGHTSSHSDPRYNARLQFERQLEFISKLTQYRGGRFMMMSETYEEIDRFATMQDPVNPKEADLSDEATCRNIAARLAKRLILSQQRENRLRIEGITSESHHSAFADPAIIRRTVELFAQGKKVLLLTNDASVAIRAMGMCDDLQRTNDIDDDSWDEIYAPLRPMVMTFDDLKILDAYTRQYHFLQQAAGKTWMEDVPQRMERRNIVPLFLWLEGFRPGDRYSEKKMQQKQQQAQNQQKQKQEQQKKQEQQPKQKQEQQPKQKQEQQPKQKQEQQPKQKQEQPKQDQPKQEQKPVETQSSTTVNTPVNQPVEVANDNTAEAVNNTPTEEPTKEKKSSRRGGRRSPRKKNPAPAQ